MLALFSSSVGLNMAASRPAVKSVRAQSAQMYDINAFDEIWELILLDSLLQERECTRH